MKKCYRKSLKLKYKINNDNFKLRRKIKGGCKYGN